MRERPQERAVILARLDQDGVLIGQVTGQFVVIADELAARTIERLQPFGDPPRLDPMHDSHGFDAAVAQMEERAVIISHRQRVIHFFQPCARIIGAVRSLGKRKSHEARHGARNQPMSTTTQRFAHGSACGSAGGGATRIPFTAAPFTARPLPATCCSSASAKSPDNTLRSPSTEEYWLCANT